MPFSVIAICNLALSRIGARSTVQSLNEDSTEAQTCKLLFDFARDATLEAHDWSFARARVALADLGSPPAGWSFRYALPSDCMAPRFLEQAPRTAKRLPFRIEGGALMTDAEAAVLVYTAAVVDPARFSPSFVTALSWRLGADLALPLTGKESLHQRCYAAWQQAVNTAAVSDANAEAPDAQPDADWITARG